MLAKLQVNVRMHLETLVKLNPLTCLLAANVVLMNYDSLTILLDYTIYIAIYA